MNDNLRRLEIALMAAEYAARAALVEHGIDVTALVLNVCFDTPGGALAAASKVPTPTPQWLAESLWASAAEAEVDPDSARFVPICQCSPVVHEAFATEIRRRSRYAITAGPWHSRGCPLYLSEAEQSY